MTIPTSKTRLKIAFFWNCTQVSQGPDELTCNISKLDQGHFGRQGYKSWKIPVVHYFWPSRRITLQILHRARVCVCKISQGCPETGVIGCYNEIMWDFDLRRMSARFLIVLDQWKLTHCLVTKYIWVNIGPGYGFDRRWGLVAFTWGQFHRKCSLIRVRKSLTHWPLGNFKVILDE